MKKTTRDKLPQHIGIMIDGNRRWARSKGLPTFTGHLKGIQRAVEIVDYAFQKGIKVLTLYGFSTENWKRSKEEVSYLMDLFFQFAKKYAPIFHEKGIRFRHIGRKDRLPSKLIKEIRKAEELTKENSRMVLNIALDYGGRDEIVRAVKKIVKQGMPEEQITEKLILENLDTNGLPDVDLVIRTSGEMRLSNFLPLQSTYAELYFPKIYWPDFTPQQFDIALEEFAHRQRRFGK